MRKSCPPTAQMRALIAGLAVLACLVPLLVSRPAAAQTTTFPAWINDSFVVGNRYLVLWSYFRNADITKFDIWNELGDPDNQFDDFFYVVTIDAMGNRTLVSPWGSRLFSAPHPPFTVASPDTRPYCNGVIVRVVDPMATSGFNDLLFPDGFTAVYGPPVIDMPRAQGFYSPWRNVALGLEVNQKLQFARDLVRVEYVVKNTGQTARQVGLRLLLDPFVDYGFYRTDFTNPDPTKSMFFPETRDRVFYETDFGQRTGTPVRPRNPAIPAEWQLFDDDEGPNPNFIAKGILTGNGATTPTRFSVVNTLNIFNPLTNQWDYTQSGQNPQELRISDIGTLLYWDPVPIAAGQTRSFVTYGGVGVASHVMSNAYLRAQAADPNLNETQGYIGAVQTPFAIPLADGNADIDLAGLPAFAPLTCYMQNMYHISGVSNAFAFVELPDGLQFEGEAPTLRAKRVDLGNLSPVGLGVDEGVGRIGIQATGVEAGQIPISITFSNSFQDSTRLTRVINVPQGRQFELSRDFRMLTFPFTYNNLADDPADVVGLPPSDFQMLRWNPQINQYEQVSRVRPGEGYWIRVLNLKAGDTRFIRLSQARPIKLGTNDTSRVGVKTGWNQVGNPSPYAVRVADIGILGDGGQILDFDRAVSSGAIRSAVYEYNRKTNEYVQLSRNTLVQPGRGIWLFSTAERTLVWRAPQGPQLSIVP